MSDLKKITINGAVYEVTPASHAENKSNPHKVTDEQVGAAPSGYGLGVQGAEQSTDDATVVDSYKINGWVKYFNADNVSLIAGLPNSHACLIRIEMFNWDYGKQTAHTIAGVVAERTYWQGAWTPWEIVNPPMTPGVEYRTTDRYKGSAVYKKVGGNGDILWRIDGESKWRLWASASYVSE